MPLVDANYKIDPTVDSRALPGTSLRGRWASYMGLTQNDLFHLIGIQSHTVDVGHLGRASRGTWWSVMREWV